MERVEGQQETIGYVNRNSDSDSDSERDACGGAISGGGRCGILLVSRA